MREDHRPIDIRIEQTDELSTQILRYGFESDERGRRKVKGVAEDLGQSVEQNFKAKLMCDISIVCCCVHTVVRADIGTGSA